MKRDVATELERSSIDRADVAHGYVCIDRRHRLAEARRERHWIVGRPYDHRHVPGRRLEERPIDLRFDPAREAVVLHVADHAHNSDPVVFSRRA